MATMPITDNNYAKVIQNNKLVLIDFWAPWCGPCRMIAPILEQLSEEVGDAAVIAKLNVDENPTGAVRYSIQGIPTMILFRNGVEVERFVGVQPLQVLKSAVMKHARQ
ncbi:thioredoxin [Paenibacillus oceani]|uniref:Thioredoxin n=1 Tax=Paenibacillus oceani TaxID=2772510 RepID=A0A927C7R6_9BACL|nr:thioredoxin [Paenibacillus oceani]MBD2861683.1 thioredoxin [Paenibacillus oceani]